MKTFYSINGRPVQDTEFAPFAASAMALMQDRLRDVEAERDYLAAMLDRVWALVPRCENYIDPYSCARESRNPDGYCLPCQFRAVLDAPTTGDSQCRNGHPFVPGRSTDDAPDDPGNPLWCNTCGEQR